MSNLTLREILAGVNDYLASGGYTRGASVPDDSVAGASELRLFEDRLGVVAVAGFETWDGLLEGWAEAQSVVVNLISQRIGRNEPKAWEGYLVLVTPESPPPDSHMPEMGIQYDTSLLRKLVGSGNTLETTEDIKRFLAPLLPISPEQGRKYGANVLDRIPSLLEDNGIDIELGNAIVQAFADQSSVMQTIHRHLWGDENQAT